MVFKLMGKAALLQIMTIPYFALFL